MAEEKKVLDNSEVRIAWIDVETNGKSPYEGKRLIQVAAIITDGNLNELNPGFERKVYFDEDEVVDLKAEANQYVKDMHTANGLWDLLPIEGHSLVEIEKDLLKELKLYIPEAGTALFGGNSITLDRNFLAVELPSVLEYVSYQSYDMTSVAKHYAMNVPNFRKFEKKYTHDALADIRESIAEARYYSNFLQALAKESDWIS